MEPKRRKLLLAILAVLVVLVWVRGLTVQPARSRRPAPSKGPVTRPLELEIPRAQPRPLTQRPGRSRFAEWGENPFEIERRTPPTPLATPPGGHALSGILWDPEVPSAILDGRLVRKGDRLEDGWEVVQIQKDRVILSNGLTTKTLTVE